MARLLSDPVTDHGVWRRGHQFRQDVGVEHHHRNSFLILLSGIGSRLGIFRSTPPKGANRSRIASPRFSGSESARASPVSNSSRASCSIERPLRAARMRSRRLVFSGSRRMVMLAMTAMIALQSLIAQGITNLAFLACQWKRFETGALRRAVLYQLTIQLHD